MKWADSTSYSRGDTERKPTSWRLDGDVLSVSVVYNHRYRPGEWVYHCVALNLDTEPLPGVSTEQEAKVKALEAVEARLCKMMDAVSLMRQAL